MYLQYHKYTGKKRVCILYYIRCWNPASNVLKELKQAHNFDTEKRKALTMQEQ